ncbi:hypothetical protein Lal_00030952 [Lupinus albus]|nr:hypothetical protein Lal_00030952 [Lupinus albus]
MLLHAIHNSKVRKRKSAIFLNRSLLFLHFTHSSRNSHFVPSQILSLTLKSFDSQEGKSNSYGSASWKSDYFVGQ